MAGGMRYEERIKYPKYAVCRTVAGLARVQQDLCHRHPDVTAAALQGLRLAAKECQHQFQWNRWNCSTLSTKSRNPHRTVLFQKGYRESAFAYAISAAGVAYSVAKTCSQGRLLGCGCDPYAFRNKSKPSKYSSRWKWGGCSHNIHFGISFSKKFLDAREKVGDIHSQINLHNNEAGRMVLVQNMIVRCKCHGMSGSCELRTCWKSAPDFRQVGQALKKRFQHAVLVDQSNLSNEVSPRRRRPKANSSVRKWPKRDLSSTLYYYEQSPNFCEKDHRGDFPGTAGRRCKRNSDGDGSCASLCCGRGYNEVRTRKVDRCNCKFYWCCYVNCQNCTIEEWITVCK